MAAPLYQRLVRLRANNSTAKAVFDCLKEYKKSETALPVAVIAKKTALTEREVRDVFRALQTLKVGRLWTGRRGAPTRFQWFEDLRDVIPGAQPGESVEPSLATPADIAAELGTTTATLNKWTIRLGGRREAVLLLPANVTDIEMKRVRAFCDAYVVAMS